MTETQEFKPKLIKIFNYGPDVKEIMEIDFMEIDFMGYGSQGGRKGRKSSDVDKKDRERNIKRIKRNVRRLAFSNNLGQVHLILTYAENMKDANKSDQHFKEFMKAVHKVYPNLKYLATREFQKRGAIHYHILLNQRIDVKKAQKMWSHGFISLVQHKNKLKAVMYALKYISKGIEENVLQTENGHTKKSYLSSHGLKTDLEKCTMSYLINNPDAYVEYNDGVNLMITNLTEGWDIPFEIEIENGRTIHGRSILRCAANNY
jgi:hypothetical protein